MGALFLFADFLVNLFPLWATLPGAATAELAAGAADFGALFLMTLLLLVFLEAFGLTCLLGAALAKEKKLASVHVSWVCNMVSHSNSARR